MARTVEQERRRTQVHSWIALTIILAGVTGVFMWLGSTIVDRWFADAEGAYVRATVLGRDVAPGDPIVIRIGAAGELKTVIKQVRAKLGGTQVTADGSDRRIGATIGSRETVGDDGRIELTVPADAPVDAILPIRVSVELEVARAVGSHEYMTSTTADTVTLDLYVRSPSGRTVRIVFDLGLAALAWFAAAVLSYIGARWRPVGDRGPKVNGAPVDDGTINLWAIILIFALVAIGVLGDLVFVRRLERITSSDALVLRIALLTAWLAALVAGALLGMRGRRADLRWWRARLRPVIGTPPLTDAFRGAHSKLPPTLSRDVDAKPVAEVLAALTAAGFTHDRRVISSGGAPVARLAPKLDAVRPEQLALDVFEGYDAVPLARALTAVYGPLEISSRFTPATIVDPQ